MSRVCRRRRNDVSVSVTRSRDRGWGFTLATVALALTAILGGPVVGHAQITVDGTLGSAGALTGPNFTIGSGLGQIRGNNLFHSFGQFNVNNGETATFTGPSSIANILSRVTGGQQSLINGGIDSRSFMPNANFFLLNPSGIILGGGASFNVGGAIHLTTADYVKFSDGAKFFANPANASTLTVAEPAAFGFLGPTGPVSVQGSFLFFDPGQTLSLVGGDVQITGGTQLTAPGGRIQIASVASAGEITIADLGVSAGTRLGNVAISGGSVLDTSGDPAGTVVIRAGQLSLDGSFIVANTGDVDGAPVGVDLGAQDGIVLTNGAVVATGTFGLGRGGDLRVAASRVALDNGFLRTSAFGDGAGGDLSVAAADSVIISGGGAILTLNSSFGTGKGGNVTVSALNSITIAGKDEFGSASSLFSETDFAGPGGLLTISTPSLVLQDGGRIFSTAGGDGLGGGINISVGSLSLIGEATIASFTSATNPGGAITVDVTGAALLAGGGTAISSSNDLSQFPPGAILLTVGSLNMTDGALIQSGGQVGSQGGDITITAHGPITIASKSGISNQAFTADVGPIVISTPSLDINGGFISTAALNTGNAGNVMLNVGNLSLTGGGQIVSGSIGSGAQGAGGDITINATGTVTISGSSTESVLAALGPQFTDVFTNLNSGIFSTAVSLDPLAGAAGKVIMRTGVVTMTDGGQISVSTSSTGAGGEVRIVADTAATIAGASTGLFSTAESSGAAGQITVSAPTLSLTDGAKISVATSGAGNAGDIALNVNNFTLGSGARVDSSTSGTGQGGSLAVSGASSVSMAGPGSGLFSTTSSQDPAAGAAGSITVTTPALALTEGAEISVATTGAGNAGTLKLDVAGTLSVAGGATVTSSTSGSGQGGSLSVNAGSASLTGTGGGLFSTAESSGAAGQVTVSTPTLSLTDGAKISVATSGAGNAGDIALNVNNFTLGGGARVDSSTFGTGQGGSLAVSGASSVSMAGPRSGLFSTTSSQDPAAGAAGSITVVTPALALTEGAEISVATTGAGNAGTLKLDVAGSLSVAGGAVTSSTSGSGQGGSLTVSAGSASLTGTGGGLFSTAESSGAAGQITVFTPTLSLTDGAKISVATTGAGNAGDVALNVGTMSLASGARIDSSTSGTGKGGFITVNAPTGTFTMNAATLSSDTSNTGVGGDINIVAQAIELANGAKISASSTGTSEALAGTINIIFGSTFSMTDSNITTDSKSADGGNIWVTSTGSFLHVVDSGITTSVFTDVGNGGNILLGSQAHPLDFLILDGGAVRADAFKGHGGNITINADVYLNSGTPVTATSALSAPGTVNIQAHITNVSGALVQLPESVLHAAALLRASCSTRLAEGNTSSLVVAGREGVPPAPDGPLWSPLADLGSGSALSGMGEGPWERFPRLAVIRSGCVR